MLLKNNYHISQLIRKEKPNHMLVIFFGGKYFKALRVYDRYSNVPVHSLPANFHGGVIQLNFY